MNASELGNYGSISTICQEKDEDKCKYVMYSRQLFDDQTLTVGINVSGISFKWMQLSRIDIIIIHAKKNWNLNILPSFIEPTFKGQVQCHLA